MRHCLTIDVEDWYHYYPQERWSTFQSRVIEPLKWILAQLAKRKIKATFFILGYIAERHPDLVKEIFNCGHEIGCHGYGHKLVFEITPQEFDIDIKKALYHIEAAIGSLPDIYRAPAFSITAKTPWVWKILYQNGIRRDSSIKVAKWKRKGFKYIPEKPFKFKVRQGCYIEEYPLTPMRFLGINTFSPGGSYFRIIPIKFIKKGLQNSKKPIIFYIHPRDIDPDQPRIKELSFLRKWITYYNLNGCREKFIELLDTLEVGNLQETYKNIDMKEIYF